MPRLPSGVYFTLLADAAANEANYVPEYPTFPSLRGAEGGSDQAEGSPTTPPGVGVTMELPHRPAPNPPQPRLCLPLVDVSIDMQVDNSIAKTKLVQTFRNHGSTPIPEAWYSFPLYDGATVTAFRCEVGDDKVLEGKVKPKEEARQEFAKAVQKQEAAALVEEVTPEVFQTTIGNIAPKTTIRVEITYIEELHTDLGGDGVLVTIPTSVAPRYGTPPEGSEGKGPSSWFDWAGRGESSTPKEPRLEVVITVATSRAEKPIVCRSGHDIKIEYEDIDQGSEDEGFEDLAAPESQPGTGSTSKHATIRMSKKAVMDKDFILFIPSPDENLRRSQAVLAQAADSDHSAVMVTVRPSELFSDLRESMSEFDGEVMFLADRSGSMSGTKIEELRNALFVFVKSLPAKCKFNLYSFGSSVSGLWDSSVPYTEATVQQALDHISTFRANFGGTEILNALKKAVGDRKSAEASSTQVILLTDGEIWQVEETIEFVRMNTAKADGQLRFFSLGLGNRVSHQLIQGIGMLGGGFGEVATVDSAGRWKEAVIRILKGAIMPNSWSYSVSIGDGWDEKRLDVDDVFPKLEQKASGPSFVQAPRNIPLLHHYGQQSVFFLLDTISDKLPKQVTITASSQYGGTKTATLKVTRATPNNTTIHHLAAKAAVRDLESQDVPDAISSDIIRSNAEHLCQTYSISSRWASFVAVSHLQEQSMDDEYVEVSVYKAPIADPALVPSLVPSTSGRAGGVARQTTRGPVPRKQLASKAARMSAPTHSAPQQFMQLSAQLSAFCDPAKATGTQSGAFAAPAGPPLPPNTSSEQRFSMSQGGMPSTFVSMIASSPALMKPRAKRPKIAPVSTVPAVHDLDYDEPTTSEAPADNLCAVAWQDIVLYQRIDGLFDLEKSVADRLARHFCPRTQEALGLWVEKHAADTARGSESVGLLANTVMALAYLRSHFYPERALWELLVQKAEGSIASRLEPGQWDRPDGLSAMADSALAHAHYGRCSQDGAKADWWKSGPDGGNCGVCNDQSGQQTQSADDELSKCSFSGCDISMSPWDQFWTHAIEQGHITSSCQVANGRSELAELQPEQDERRRSQRVKMARTTQSAKKTCSVRPRIQGGWNDKQFG